LLSNVNNQSIINHVPDFLSITSLNQLKGINPTMIRGDNDLYSVMDQMMAGEINSLPEEEAADLSNKYVSSDIRMVPEIEGYGTNKSIPEQGTCGNIWNPLVRADSFTESDISSDMDCIPPTNPWVEVARRRCYEKFKKKFYSTFSWIASNRNPQSKATDPGSLWGKMPPHSILERFYFACKTKETFLVLEKRKKALSTEHLPQTNCEDMANIVSLMSIQKNKDLLIDPILISPFQTYPTSYSMLRNEIEFQFKREWRKSNKGNVDILDLFFASSSFQKKCMKICREVNELAIEVSRDFIEDLKKKSGELSSSSHYSRRNVTQKKGIPKLTFSREQDTDRAGYVETFSVTFAGLSFRISRQHFEKLQLLYDRFNKKSKSPAVHKDLFHSAIFVLLARYDLLEGAGLQSSLNGSVFDILLEHFDCRLECFASPLNSRYERFCSAYVDTDRKFGSLGSFFNFNFEGLKSGGCFQANPPFTSDFIHAMCIRMEHILTNAQLQVPFMFIVFVPAWKDSKGWQSISKASSLVHHLFLSQKDNPHYYTEGTQHRRMKGRYRMASFDTSVFFLQNHKAKEKWPITEMMLQELRNAFALNPEGKTFPGAKVAALKTKQDIEGERNARRVTSKETSKKHMASDIPLGKPSKGKKRQMLSTKRRHISSKKMKKLVSDDSQSQLNILSSLGIPEAAKGANISVDIAKTREKGRQRKKK